MLWALFFTLFQCKWCQLPPFWMDMEFISQKIINITIMDPKSKVFFVLSVLLVAQINAQSSPASPPPPSGPAPPIPSQSASVSGSAIFSLPYTPATDIYVGFSSIQGLKITHNADSTTSFYYNFFNKAASDNVTTLSILNVAGTWDYIGGTTQNFSCGVVATSAGVIQLLRYINGTFDLKPVPAQSPLNAALLSQYRGSSDSNPDNYFKVGDNCRFMLISNVLYNVNDDTIAMSAVTLPPSTTLMAANSNFQVVVLSGSLYKWNTVGMNYLKIATLSTTLTHYKVETSGPAIFVYGWVFSTVTSQGQPIQATNYIAYIFADSPTSTVLIDSFSDQYENQYPPNFMVSLKITKLGTGYTKIGQTDTTIAARSVDYKNKLAAPIIFQNLAHYMSLVTNNLVIVFSDYFLYVRTATNPPIEAAYQFVGSSMLQIKESPLSSSFVSRDWKKSFIDSTQTQALIIYSSYLEASNFVVYAFNFGSLQSNVGPTPSSTLPPPTNTFTIPTNTQSYYLNNLQSWTYLSGSTTVTTVEGNIIDSTITLAGSYTLYAQSPSCKIFSDGTNYKVYIKSSTTNQYSSFNDATSVLGAVSGISSSNVKVSSQCLRIQANTAVFRHDGTSSYVPVTSPPLALSLDNQLMIGVAGDQIFAYRSQSQTYVSVYNDTFFPLVKVWSSPQGAVIYSQKENSTNAANFDVTVNVYSGTNTLFTKVFNGTASFVGAAPTIIVASDLTTFAALGAFANSDGTNTFTAKAIALDFNNQKFTPIDLLDGTTALDRTYTYDTKVTANFLYSRVTASPTNVTEYVLALQFGKGKTIFSNPVSLGSITAFKRSIVQEVNKVLTVLIEEVTTTTSTLKQRSFGLNTPPVNPHAQGALVVNGKTYQCGPGCTTCSGTALCTVCSAGFLLNANSGCDLCGPNCVTCSAKSVCLTCQDGTYLVSADSSCNKCPSGCFKCVEVGGVGKCSSCPPGSLLSSAKTCGSCALKNCKTCDPNTNTACIECFNGFFPDAITQACVQCVSFCATCSPSDITNCLSCAVNQQLVSGKCVRCPQHCAVCSSGSCVQCQPGFTATNGICALSCQSQCLTCASGQPSFCLTCFSGSIAQGGACVPDLSCVATLSCTVCPSGYILVQGGCYQCNTGDANCLQCSLDNSQICVGCKAGYYLDQVDSTCMGCGTNCRVCTGSQTCTSCMDGYTLLGSASASVCYACQSPCLTCMGDVKTCSSCEAGYNLNGWKCASTSNVAFSLTLQALPPQILALIQTIVAQLLAHSQKTDPNDITFDFIKSGSTILGGTVASSTPTATQSQLSAGLNVGALGGFSIISVSLVASDAVAGTSVLPIALGVSIPIVALIIIAIIVYCKCIKKEQTTTIFPMSRDGHEMVADVSMVQIPNNKCTVLPKSVDA